MTPKKKLPLPKIKKRSVAKAKKELDAIFSRFIRWRDNGKCFTCNLVRHPKEMQNGHFVPRQFNSTRYDERNNNCQCYACNMLYNGQPDIYALRLEEKYGIGIVKELNALRKKITQFTVPELEEMKKIYTEKLAEIYYE